MKPSHDPSGTRIERQNPKPAGAPPAATLVRAGAPSLHTLPPDERRVVALCCAMRGRAATDLLEMLAPQQACSAVAAGESISGLDRNARLSLLSRQLSPPSGTAQVGRLANALGHQPAWAAALAAPFVPVEARRALPAARPLPNAAHPALQTWSRRLVARALQ